MNIDGGCHCGKITFTATADPEQAFICHCNDCQVLSGAPFRTVLYISESDVQFTNGQPRVYVKTAQSGRRREQTFCPDCGSPIYSTTADSTTDGGPRDLAIRLGAVNQRAQIVPKKQIWYESSQKWLDGLHDIKTFDQQ